MRQGEKQSWSARTFSCPKLLQALHSVRAEDTPRRDPSSVVATSNWLHRQRACASWITNPPITIAQFRVYPALNNKLHSIPTQSVKCESALNTKSTNPVQHTSLCILLFGLNMTSLLMHKLGLIMQQTYFYAAEPWCSQGRIDSSIGWPLCETLNG